MRCSNCTVSVLSATDAVFLYLGLPGEPALGPPAFMHRASSMDLPEAPITHHWLDSTHITYGVLTGGYVLDKFKVEVSGFRGREPDQHRYDIEHPALDSLSTRLTWNPIPDLSAQVSWGYLHSPEQLEPNVNENRLTASFTYNKPFGDGNNWATTFAWGRKMNQPGHTLDGFLLDVPRNMALANKYWSEEVNGANALVQRTKRLVFRVPHYRTGKELADEVAAAKKK